MQAYVMEGRQIKNKKKERNKFIHNDSGIKPHAPEIHITPRNQVDRSENNTTELNSDHDVATSTVGIGSQKLTSI
jgi:hypothetical protein